MEVENLIAKLPSLLRLLTGKVSEIINYLFEFCINSIGLSIAKQLAIDGAMVMVSSRKQNHVDEVVSTLQRTVGNAVCGTVCHVGKEEDRKQLIEEVHNLLNMHVRSQYAILYYSQFRSRLNVRMCVWAHCVPVREEAGHSCKSLNLQICPNESLGGICVKLVVSRTSRACIHAHSNAAKINCIGKIPCHLAALSIHQRRLDMVQSHNLGMHIAQIRVHKNANCGSSW